MRALLKRCAVSFSAGFLAGALYWLMGVRSPAPPWISLAGLLGILVGEYAVRTLLDRRRGGPPPTSTATTTTTTTPPTN
ncbi:MULTISPECIES: DUF1427 family protein [unclassified Streptomyces]|uniref:DUF1427 family protein n=1 Tax=unclassified Streptomyces TaxID=2593676 RepID=UPI00381BC427